MSVKTTDGVELAGSTADTKAESKQISDNGRVMGSPVSSIGADLRATAGNHGIYRETCPYLFLIDKQQAEEIVGAHIDQACRNREKNPAFFIIIKSPDVPNHIWLIEKKNDEKYRMWGYTLEEKTWIQTPHYLGEDRGKYSSLKELCEFWEKQGYKGIQNKTPCQLECSPVGYQAKASTRLDPTQLDHYFDLTSEQQSALLKEVGSGFAFLRPSSNKEGLRLVYIVHHKIVNDKKVHHVNLRAKEDNNWDGPVDRYYDDVSRYPIYKSLNNACDLVMDGQKITWLTKDNIQTHAPIFATRWPEVVKKANNSSSCILQ